ncbi:MAG: metallophosphoesterase [Oscillospiraceae bacterium]|nr:metallophosphoesterase [Oscillospiraceae bacterium]
MSLFVIADLHLSLSVNKPMDIFGGWDNHVERLTENWQSSVAEDDVVVIPGDVSWAMNFNEAKADFDYINKLSGRKVILKGNHDYWWNTMSKMNRFLNENGFDTIKIINNNHYPYEEYGICGTRGWINESEVPADAKVLAREAQRLEMSIQSALADNKEPIVFLHYPPIYANDYNYDIIDVLFKYNIKKCYYGHLHGKAHRFAVNGVYDGIEYQLISSDFMQFAPKKIM